MLDIHQNAKRRFSDIDLKTFVYLIPAGAIIIF